MAGGQGVVLDSETQAPIGGATVVLECRRGVFPHGSEFVDKFEATTDDRGRYFFSQLKLGLCGYGYVTPYMREYVATSGLDVRYAYTSYERIPERLYLTPSSEATMKQIRYFLFWAVSPKFGDASSAYYEAFSEFLHAKAVAKSEREVAFVRSSFCPTLKERYGRLSAEEKAKLRRFSSAPPNSELVEHERVVSPFCD